VAVCRTLRGEVSALDVQRGEIVALSLPKRFLQAVSLTALAALYEAAPRTSDLKLYGQVPVGQRAPESQSAGLKLWYVDINRKGTQCLIDSERLQLWRASADKARTIRLSGPANFPTATVDFAAGQSVVDVDSATFPVGDGLSLTISDNQTGLTLGEIVIAVLAAGSDTPEKLADALKERGCLKQVQLLESSKVHPKS